MNANMTENVDDHHLEAGQAVRNVDAHQGLEGEAVGGTQDHCAIQWQREQSVDEKQDLQVDAELSRGRQSLEGYQDVGGGGDAHV